MRPVRLELDGFGSFRQPSTVDFTDADFFALVGPTSKVSVTTPRVAVGASAQPTARRSSQRGTEP